jgi:hypothetical protein
MREVKSSSRDLISTLPNKLHQKLSDGYRVKLFAKIKDSLDRKNLSLEQEQTKKLINKCSFDLLEPINNSCFVPMLRA